MEAHFKLLEYMRRDITDSIEGVVSPVITLALDTQITRDFKYVYHHLAEQ